MKKFLLMSLVALVALTGCTKEEEKGNFKEGTYFASIEAPSYGKNYVTTAVVYVNENGFIKSVFLDNTYFKDEAYTTKKALGSDYAMKQASPIGKEWDEQARVIEEKVIAEQGLDWAKLTDDKKLDGVSGVTITADGYVEVIKAALDQAK